MFSLLPAEENNGRKERDNKNRDSYHLQIILSFFFCFLLCRYQFNLPELLLIIQHLYLVKVFHVEYTILGGSRKLMIYKGTIRYFPRLKNGGKHKLCVIYFLYE